jgi:hypothetical protein
LNNEIQLQNYVNLCLRNPKVSFALWTKQYKIAEKFFINVSKPKNLILIYSSIMKNVELKLDSFKFVDKIFTVFEKEIVKSKNITINCGAKSCLTCQSCYKKQGKKYIREIKK